MAFKEAELADHPGVLRVIQYNPDLETLPEVLGLTEERQDALVEITKEAMNKAESLAELMMLISKKVDNVNELSFTMLNLGANLRDQIKRDQEKASKTKSAPTPGK